MTIGNNQLVALIYLWTRDARVPVEEMHDYCLSRLGWWRELEPSFSDIARATAARKIVEELAP